MATILEHQYNPVNYRARMQETFAAWLTRQLARREMTPAEFGKKIGVPTSTVTRWINEGRRPTTRNSDLIADALGVDLDTVLALVGHRPNADPDDPPELADLFAYIRRLRPDGRKVAMIRALVTSIEAVDRAEVAGQPRPGSSSRPSRQTQPRPQHVSQSGQASPRQFGHGSTVSSVAPRPAPGFGAGITTCRRAIARFASATRLR